MTTLAEAIAAASGNSGNGSDVKFPGNDRPVSAGLEKVATAVNDDPSLINSMKQSELVSLDDWLNSHDLFQMPPSVRSSIHRIATAD